mmetsp:Transcript_26473/g.57074  ORF Transcript_26473/g.57074 Transcript_26473/m.57074 type:complete len:309 (-) Transcript_26473:6-932(-)
MAYFHRLHRQCVALVASICAILFASLPYTPSLSLPIASAFSHRHVATARGPPTSVISSAPSSSSSLRTSSKRGGSLTRNDPYLFQTYLEHALEPLHIRKLKPSSLALHARPGKYEFDLAALPSDSADDEGAPSENSPTTTKESSSLQQDLRSITTLVGVQSLLLPISYFLAGFLNVANHGLGVGFAWTSAAAIQGLKWTLPLFVIAAIMQLIEPYSKSLQEVTKATQRSVLAVMGKKRRPLFAFFVSILLGAAAGWGEEWLFRGVFQTILSDKYSSDIALAICGVVFGLLHAVTPVYALLAGLGSVFF